MPVFYENLFDLRHRDIDTGKLNGDKLRTLNSIGMGDLYESTYYMHYEPGYICKGNDSYKGLEEKYNDAMYPARAKKVYNLVGSEQREQRELAKTKRMEAKEKKLLMTQALAAEKQKRDEEHRAAKEQIEVAFIERQNQLIEEQSIKLMQFERARRYHAQKGSNIRPNRWVVK